MLCSFLLDAGKRVFILELPVLLLEGRVFVLKDGNLLDELLDLGEEDALVAGVLAADGASFGAGFVFERFKFVFEVGVVGDGLDAEFFGDLEVPEEFLDLRI